MITWPAHNCKFVPVLRVQFSRLKINNAGIFIYGAPLLYGFICQRIDIFFGVELCLVVQYEGVLNLKRYGNLFFQSAVQSNLLIGFIFLPVFFGIILILGEDTCRNPKSH